MQRIDVYPTHVYEGYKVRPGRPYPFGAQLVPGGINFSVFSRHADYCVLVLFEKGSEKPMVEIPFRGVFKRADNGDPTWGEFRIGNVFAMTVFDLDHENLEYGYRMNAPHGKAERGKPGFHRFDPTVVLLDPYAKSIGGRDVWGELPDWNAQFQYRGRIVQEDFDWEGDRPLEIPLEDLVIYEMHVRSFTKHPTAKVRSPGTFAALRDKIPYLKDLGVNCVELMPIFEFDEFEHSRKSPVTDEMLYNYWGYSTVGFFAPKAGFAATGRMQDGTMVADELRATVRELHRAGIEVMLDVVFNHTAEGNEYGPTISFKGIDNPTYYMLTPEGYYFNFSGTGNTLNCNNPIVRNMVLDALRHWASEFHIDGFRFDLAAILGRDAWGAPLSNPPLLEALAHDPILGKCKLVAEAWDAGGLYQVGSFPSYGRWAEWNGKYRDNVRRFLKGDEGLAGAVAQAVQGSPDLYQTRGPTASINFITCHDGMTMMDLVSYNQKHNEANGEENRDGNDDNYSWNCGVEGPSDDPEINRVRERQIKNAMALLLTSHGVPMILMGDEVGRTQKGNNNTYCHDNDLNWLDWTLLEKHRSIHRFVRSMIKLRHAHPVLRTKEHMKNRDTVGSGFPDVSWHGVEAWKPDWNGRSLAYLLCGRHARDGEDDYVYVATNSYWDALSFELPRLPAGMSWHVFANTGVDSPGDAAELGKEPRLEDQNRFLMGPRSVAVLIGR
ncbi:MAG: glycogen debranching protein GlgX [Deltaproteobacteria bacterium]|nr:glycogen debranching protein GlgX [Deltaproteobacteria bacterium]